MNVNNLDRREDARPLRDSRIEQGKRCFARINDEDSITLERRFPTDAEGPAQRAAVKKATGKSAGAPRLVLLPERFAVKYVTGEIKGVPKTKARKAKI